MNMKIAVACSGLGHVARGMESSTADLGKALADRGEDVRLFKGGGRADADYERVIPCWQRGQARTKRLHRWILQRGFWRIGLGSPYDVEQATFIFGLLRHLRRERFDILHVQDPPSALAAQRACRLGWTRTRVVYGNSSKEPPEFLRKITYLHHMSPYYLEKLRGEGLWKPTWTAIPYSIDADMFHPGRNDSLREELGIPRDALVVISAAAVKRHHKRVDYLVEEFSRLVGSRPDLRAWLIVAGAREPETDAVIQQGREVLGDRVRFLVDFPRERMPDLYRASDVFVLCSLREMFGLVMAEASASGLPCLVHDDPMLRWVVGPGGAAVTMTEPGALARQLCCWLDDPSRRQELGALARRHSLASFSRERVLDQVLAYYRFVLSHDESSVTQPTAAAAPGPAL